MRTLYKTSNLLYTVFLISTVLLCSEFNSGVNFCRKMFAVIFICGNLFLRVTGKIAKIRTRKNFVPHDKMGSVISQSFYEFSRASL